MTPEELMKFVGRKDVHAIQLDTGAYVPVKTPFTLTLLSQHLSGKKTLGTYLIREDGLINFVVVDIDGDPSSLPFLKRLAQSINTLFPDFETVIEFSGRRGYHVWIFFKSPEQPKFMRNLVKSRLNRKGYRNIEIYPKQDEVSGKGFGNLIKMPCGIHRKSGKRSQIELEKKI